jgi:hypothetical protein
MRRSRVLVRASALLLGAAVVLTPLNAASAKTKSPTGINAGSAFCKLLRSQEGVGQRYANKIETAFSSGSLTKAKTAVDAEFNFGAQYVGKALAAGKVPGPIESALKYFLKLYQQEKSSIQHATNLTALESSLSSLSRSPKFTAENQTITAYVSTQCGSLTTAST